MTASKMKTALKISITIAIIGAAVSAVSLLTYFVRYSQHDAKIGLIPYDDYLELTRMTLIEKYFLAAGSISCLIAGVVAIIILVRIRSRRQ
ncbi:hypothetical protein ABH924_001311 [Arthrobacter sp. GAS37]